MPSEPDITRIVLAKLAESPSPRVRAWAAKLAKGDPPAKPRRTRPPAKSPARRATRG